MLPRCRVPLPQRTGWLRAMQSGLPGSSGSVVNCIPYPLVRNCFMLVRLSAAEAFSVPNCRCRSFSLVIKKRRMWRYRVLE